MCIEFLTADRQIQVMKSNERHFFHYTEHTYHCIIMHSISLNKQKQSIIKLNKHSINTQHKFDIICNVDDFRNKNMFRNCIMKLK